MSWLGQYTVGSLQTQTRGVIDLFSDDISVGTPAIMSETVFLRAFPPAIDSGAYDLYPGYEIIGRNGSNDDGNPFGPFAPQPKADLYNPEAPQPYQKGVTRVRRYNMVGNGPPEEVFVIFNGASDLLIFIYFITI